MQFYTVYININILACYIGMSQCYNNTSCGCGICVLFFDHSFVETVGIFRKTTLQWCL